MSDGESFPAAEPCLCTAVRQAARRLSQHYDLALAPLAIGVNQYAVLARAERLGPSTIADLAENLVMDRSTLGHLLRPLLARGLLSLAAAAGDRRRKVVGLTAAGQALLAEARPLWARAQAEVLAAYGRDAARDLRLRLDAVAVLDLAPEAAAPPAGAGLPPLPPGA